MIGSNYLDSPERCTKALFLLANDGFLYALNRQNNSSNSVSIRQYQRLREGLTLQELVSWEQYLYTGCWIETKSAKEKIFRSEQKAILAIEEEQVCWTIDKNHDYYFIERIKKEYHIRISEDNTPSMLRWALNIAKQTGKDETWILKKGAVASQEQPWNSKKCKILALINREAVAKMFSHRKELCTSNSPASLKEIPIKSIKNKKDKAPNSTYKIIKSVGGRNFWEAGFRTGECPGMSCPSGMPRWFCDLRGENKIRVNSMSYSIHYLRNDGNFFHITGCCLYPEPLKNAFSNDLAKIESCLDGVYARGGKPSHSATYDIWEYCEYIPDSDCDDLSNFWKVAAAARRTGRFFYTSKKKVLKEILEGPEESIPWIYAPKFDQFTEEYEIRYKNKVQARKEEIKEEAKQIPKRVHFNFNVKNLKLSEEIDHARILQVSPNSSPREIKTSYWKLARQYHPDLNPGDEDAEEKFKQLSISCQRLIKDCLG